jgi:hypothetical protein
MLKRLVLNLYNSWGDVEEEESVIFEGKTEKWPRKDFNQ